MQGLIRLVCLSYLILLTVVLLVADPLRLVGVRGDLPGFMRTLMPVVHLLGFFGLTVLSLAARWPVPRWAVAVLLVVYAGMTEVVQSLLPPRRAEWGDWLQDLAGIAVGVALCWIIASVAGALARTRRKTVQYTVPRISNEWELAQSVISRSPARGESWWK